MLIKYIKINPGGNLTALVESHVQKNRRINIAKTILKKDREVEQVGFIRKPKNKKSLARLEMMGGEFCGNAVRSLAYYLWQKKKYPNTFYIESSGRDKLVLVKVDNNYSEFQLAIDDFSIVKRSDCYLVSMPGMCHLITNKHVGEDEVRKLLDKENIFSKKAAGVVSVKKIGNKFIINPFVWVRDTQTLYNETACASGSLAVACVLSFQKKQKVFQVVQPSNYIYTVKYLNDNVVLGGPIVSLVNKKIQIK